MAAPTPDAAIGRAAEPPPKRPPPRATTPPIARAADRLDAARRLWLLIAAACVLATLAVAGVGALASLGHDPRPALVQSLALSAPALTPAGSPGRTPASHPAIEGALLPGVDRLAPPPARLLTPPPGAPPSQADP